MLSSKASELTRTNVECLLYINLSLNTHTLYLNRKRSYLIYEIMKVMLEPTFLGALLTLLRHPMSVWAFTHSSKLFEGNGSQL